MTLEARWGGRGGEKTLYCRGEVEVGVTSSYDVLHVGLEQ